MRSVVHLVVVAITLYLGASFPLVDASGAAMCWGSPALTNVPTNNVVWMSASVGETCGLNSSHNLQCWGSNIWGEGTVDTTGTYANVSTGMDHTCAINAFNSTVTCWGLNNHDQLRVPPTATFRSISCGWWHSCGVLTTDWTAVCWGGTGDKDMGQAAVPTTEAFSVVVAGKYHSCGILAADSRLMCWGGSFTNNSVPSGSFSRIGAGVNHSCALATNGRVTCWGGDNAKGQLNAPTTEAFIDLTVGANFACGLKTGGNILCWGDNGSGQQNPPSGYRWSNITAGQDHMCGFGVVQLPSPPASPSSLPSMSPTPSPPVAIFVPITANVTATFGGDSPVVDVATPLTSSSSPDSGNSIRVRSELSQLQADNADVANIGWTVTNSSTVGDSNSSVVLYSATLPDNTTSVLQSYAFHKEAQPTHFSSLNFTITAGAVKWSINLTNSAAGGSPAPGLRFAYRLTTNATTQQTNPAATRVTVLHDWPRANMTTYRVASGYSGVVVEVQMFDVALIDGQLVNINHSVILAVDNSTSPAAGVAYDVVVSFPGFSRSLEYDPSIGLGVLLGSSSGDGDGGGSDNTALIVGVAVAVPVAVALVLVVIVGVLVYGYTRRRKLSDSDGSIINFETRHEDEL